MGTYGASGPDRRGSGQFPEDKRSYDAFWSEWGQPGHVTVTRWGQLVDSGGCGFSQGDRVRCDRGEATIREGGAASDSPS